MSIQKGNGCTSGHGVCGLSSFRFRSFVATITFMLFAAITATSLNTSQYLPKFDNTLNLTSGLTLAAVSIIISIFFYCISFYFSDGDSLHKRILVSIIEVTCGILFAFAMAISNMSKLSATISFLDISVWNPALMFVMIGAIGISAPLFYIFKSSNYNSILLGSWSLPTSNDIDSSLLIGSALFGIGWGLVGACPGPAFTNLLGNISHGDGPTIYCSSLLVGMWVREKSANLFTASQQSYTPVGNSSQK